MQTAKRTSRRRVHQDAHREERHPKRPSRRAEGVALGGTRYVMELLPVRIHNDNSGQLLPRREQDSICRVLAVQRGHGRRFNHPVTARYAYDHGTRKQSEGMVMYDAKFVRLLTNRGVPGVSHKNRGDVFARLVGRSSGPLRLDAP